MAAGILTHPGKITFANPRPELEISTVDFISTETITGPFLVGLTVE